MDSRSEREAWQRILAACVSAETKSYGHCPILQFQDFCFLMSKAQHGSSIEARTQRAPDLPARNRAIRKAVAVHYRGLNLKEDNRERFISSQAQWVLKELAAYQRSSRWKVEQNRKDCPNLYLGSYSEFIWEALKADPECFDLEVRTVREILSEQDEEETPAAALDEKKS